MRHPAVSVPSSLSPPFSVLMFHAVAVVVVVAVAVAFSLHLFVVIPSAARNLLQAPRQLWVPHPSRRPRRVGAVSVAFRRCCCCCPRLSPLLLLLPLPLPLVVILSAAKNLTLDPRRPTT